MNEKVKSFQIMFDKKILEFIKEHHVLTMASSSQEDIWCANAFYVYDQSLPGFIITSDENTRHIKLALSEDNPTVAGSIILETETIGLIKGLQFQAIIKKADNSLLSKSRLLYLKRFPYAILTGYDLWTLELTELKYTDNRLGFGKKLLWSLDKPRSRT